MLYMDLLGLYWPQTSSSVYIILAGPYITYWPRKKSIIDNYSIAYTKETIVLDMKMPFLLIYVQTWRRYSGSCQSKDYIKYVVSLKRVWRYKGIRKSKKERQHNGHKKKDRMTNNDLQNIHIKLKIE